MTLREQLEASDAKTYGGFVYTREMDRWHGLSPQPDGSMSGEDGRRLVDGSNWVVRWWRPACKPVKS